MVGLIKKKQLRRHLIKFICMFIPYSSSRSLFFLSLLLLYLLFILDSLDIHIRPPPTPIN